VWTCERLEYLNESTVRASLSGVRWTVVSVHPAVQLFHNTFGFQFCFDWLHKWQCTGLWVASHWVSGIFQFIHTVCRGFLLNVPFGFHFNCFQAFSLRKFLSYWSQNCPNLWKANKLDAESRECFPSHCNNHQLFSHQCLQKRFIQHFWSYSDHVNSQHIKRKNSASALKQPIEKNSFYSN